MKLFKYLIIFSFSIILIGCTQDIQGEIYTKNGDTTTKLPDVEIRIVEWRKFQELMSVKKQISSNTINNIKLEAIEMEKNLDKLKIKISKYEVSWGDYSEYEELLDKYKDMIIKLNFLVKGGAKYYYPNEKKFDIGTFKSNSDGRFQIKINEPGDYVALANNGNNYWIEKIDKNTKNLNFTPSNEKSTSCDICLVD